MRKAFASPLIILAVVLLLLLAGCYQPGGPVPEEKNQPAPRDWTTADVDAAVSMTMEKIYSPVPTTNGTAPDECNYIHYLRFRPRGGSDKVSDADAVIVLQPGLMGGAGSLEPVSRMMVYMALKQRGKRLEVLVLDRRNNNLEDLTGMIAAQEAHDTQVAIDYYCNGAEIDGRKFAGFLTDADMPYFSEFGLELAMKDVYNVITTNVPDPAMRRQKVFVGGHSLGGPFTCFFAGWDFDGNPQTLDDAGYMNCAGLIGLDTLLEPDIPFLKSTTQETLNLDPPATGEEEYFNTVIQDIREGWLPRMIPANVTGPEVFAFIEVAAMEAAWHPDEESNLLDRVPYSLSLELSLQALHSRSLENFLDHVPSIKDFRFTNEALLGVMVDDNFNPMNPLQVSMGFLNGGAVVQKEFPLPQDLAKLPDLFIMKSTFNMDGQFIANDAGPSADELGTGPIYTWANFDEIGDSTDPNYMSTDGSVIYTTTTDEVSDMQDVARALYIGQTNAVEWYAPMRAMADMLIAVKDFGPKFGLNYLHADKVPEMPQVDFLTENGPMIGRTDDQPPEITIIKGYNHLDVLMAAANCPSRRPNEVIDPVLDFVLKKS